MLLDARGHLKLTDLGLCKKIGDVTPHEEPEVVLEMLKRTTISGNGGNPDESDAPERTDDGKHRGPDGNMYMTIDDGTEQAPKRDGKTRREVC